ncbi:MAG: dienelactone hydrolase family protein [Archangiaceae bacterium]|nr:dienelactone hydrolase family protein [Archangiaceae bacterium]
MVARKKKEKTVVLVPGFNGTAAQPLLVRLARLLEQQGLSAKRVTLPRGRPSPGLALEARALQAHGGDAYVGRSFGGRVCLRVPREVPRVLLGFPVRPVGRPRPDDEAALLGVRAPTLILQGAQDELGPLEVLEPLVAQNPQLTLEVIDGAGHGFGRHERRVLERAAEWLVKALA